MAIIYDTPLEVSLIPMDETSLALIKKKSLSGIIALTSRSFILQLISMVATFLLTIYLDPSVFGIFYVVSAVISFLTYFSDIGLAAALIQKKEEITSKDLHTTFTIQQFLVLLIILIAWLATPLVINVYHLEAPGVWLYRSLLFAFFLSSLKTIPSVLLERRLEFNKLIIPQIFETIGFYLVTVVLASKGYGITSFSWGVLVRAVVGLVSIYIISPWKIGFYFDNKTAHKLLKFGVPFQINSFLALIKDDLLTVFLGKALPLSHVGYIGWSKKWAEAPLRLIMDSVVKVTFPAFSRIQHSKETLSRAIEKTLFGIAVTVFPLTVSLIFFIRPFIEIFPKYKQWEPAVISFWLFCFSSAISGLSVPLTNTLNAVGQIKTTLKLMVLWTSLTWVLTVILIKYFGFNGVSLSLLSITSTIFLVVHYVKKITPFSFIGAIKYPLFGSLIQALFYSWLFRYWPTDFWVLFANIIAGLFIYTIILINLEKTRILSIVSALRR